MNLIEFVCWLVEWLSWRHVARCSDEIAILSQRMCLTHTWPTHARARCTKPNNDAQASNKNVTLSPKNDFCEVFCG
jgi:hypothetical protein